jgi:uracil-DNA glycosylase
MFIGICPGNHQLRGGADKSGIPFKGDMNGVLFGQLLEDLGITREDVYTTNLVKCRPARYGNLLYNRLPTNSEIESCYPYLVKEVECIRPKVIFCLGRNVYEKLNKELPHNVIFYAWHPSFILRDGRRLYKRWVDDIKYNIEQWTKPWLKQSDLNDFDNKGN